MRERYPYKVFRTPEPKPKKLAQIVYERCSFNAKRWEAQEPGRLLIIEPLDVFSDSASFAIIGVPAAEWQKYQVDVRDDMGEGFLATLRWKLKQNRITYRSVTGQALIYSMGRHYGFGMHVSIDWEHIFDVKLTTRGNVPRELVRCVESTYNELVEQFGEPA